MAESAAAHALAFFADLPTGAVATLLAHAETVAFRRGDLIIEQNDEARDVYFLLEGSAAALLRFEGVGDLFMGSLHDVGTIFGWSAFRPPYRYTDSIRCEQPARLLRIPRAAFDEVMAADPHTAYEILSRVTASVMHQLEITRALIEADAAETAEL